MTILLPDVASVQNIIDDDCSTKADISSSAICVEIFTSMYFKSLIMFSTHSSGVCGFCNGGSRP